MGVGGRPYWQRGGIGQLSSDEHAMRCTSTRANIRMWLKTAVITVGASANVVMSKSLTAEYSATASSHHEMRQHRVVPWRMRYMSRISEHTDRDYVMCTASCTILTRHATCLRVSRGSCPSPVLGREKLGAS